MTQSIRNSTASLKILFMYVGSIFLISWSLQLIAIFTTGNINSDKAELWLVATMFVPALITILFLVVYKHLRASVLWKPNVNIFFCIVPAVLVPTIIAFAVLIIIQQAGYGSSGWFLFSTSGVSISGGPFLLGTGNQSWVIFIANIFITALAFSLFNAIPAAGEEFAWRGFLQGILNKRYGTVKGIVLLGFIWSMWHLPAQLVGYNYGDHPMIGSFLISPLELIATSFFLGWLTIKSKSFLCAAIAHGAGNSIQDGIISNLKLSVSPLYEDLITLSVTLVIGVFFLFLLTKRKHAS